MTGAFQPSTGDMQYGWNFEFISLIPTTANEGFLNYTILFNGSTYLEPFSFNVSMFVFRSAIVGFDVNARVLTSADTLIVFGNVNDTQGHPLNNRNISLFWIMNGDITWLGSIITNSTGWFTLSYAIPLATQGNATVYARCEEAQSTISDQITIEVVLMQIPTNPLDFILQILTPLNLAIAAIGISGVVILYYLNKSGKLAFLFKPKQKKIDLKGMTKELQALVNAGDYRGAIEYAFNVFKVIVEYFYDATITTDLTARELGNMTVKEYSLPRATVLGFVGLYEEAVFSDHTIGREEYVDAMRHFAELYTQVTGGKIQLV
jgi:hypothetical protein